MFEQQLLRHRVPGPFLLSRVATLAMQAGARLADGRTRALGVPATAAARTVAPGAPLSSKLPTSLLPVVLPTPASASTSLRGVAAAGLPRAGTASFPGAAAAAAGGYTAHYQQQLQAQSQALAGQRALAQWAALRGALFPAAAKSAAAAAAPAKAKAAAAAGKVARLALPLTAACTAAAAAVAEEYWQPASLSAAHGGAPSAATHGSAASAAAAAAESTHGTGAPPPADVRQARQALDSSGFAHPGMQPGAAWGALETGAGGGSSRGDSSSGGGGGGGGGELHAMFEYVLLMPA